ncbi:DUF1874 domain-containing protein [Wenzhouxiangella sp. XN79A]|uniref:STIV orfB116 family protein n=1 Tax=Wenzhouxiangella sp. XN79A TaxID=2724193 RepID=UPI00144A6C27|nr:DUF1874 domain-containing protein [Wenzhouxiangella sp. XN79A]NKI33914.1 DUF1874 domain-containing protein [Wenzhouxiangella sp. XN79A]
MIYLLNSPVLTSYGTYEFQGPVSPDSAGKLMTEGFVSAIGHSSTAEILSDLLGHHIEHQRISVQMETGDRAIVFRLLQRVPPQDISSKQQLEEVGYELAILERVV